MAYVIDNIVFDNQYYIEAPYDEVIELSLSKFKRELSELPLNFDKQNISALNTHIFEFLCELNLGKLIVSLTSLNSIFYRFSPRNSPLQFKLEVFWDHDFNDDDSIESVLHIYNSEDKIGSYFGAKNEMMNVISSKIYENDFQVYEFDII